MKNIVFVFVVAGLVSCSQGPPQFGEPILKPGAGVRRHDADPRANLLSVYFLAEKWDFRSNLKSLKLEAQPIISGADFAAFDTIRHTFTLRAEAVERLGMTPATFTSMGEKLASWDGQDRYFLLRALGEPIYVGVFYSPYSSDLHLDEPVIGPIDGPWVRPGTNATFKIDLEPSWPRAAGAESSPPPWIWLSSWEILEYELLRPDVRDDPRVIRAAEELFAHDKTVTMSRTNGWSQ